MVITHTPTIRQIIHFIDTEAMPQATRLFNRKAYTVDGPEITFDPKGDNISLNVQDDGSIRSSHDLFPLLHVNSNNRAGLRIMWERMNDPAHAAVEHAVDRWLHPFTREQCGLTYGIPESPEFKAYKSAVAKLAHTVRSSAFDAPVKNAAAVLQTKLHEHIGADTVALAVRYAGIFANVNHFNAVIRHPQLLADAHRLSPNALTLWMILHHDNADAALNDFSSPQELFDEARDAFLHTHACVAPHDDVWQALENVSHRIVHEIPHVSSYRPVSHVARICDHIARTGVNPPYTVLKLFARARKAPDRIAPQAHRDLYHHIIFAAGTLTPQQRGSTLRQLVNDAYHVARLFDLADHHNVSNLDAQAVIDRAGLAPGSLDFPSAWRIVATIARRLHAITGDDLYGHYNDPEVAAFFYRLNTQDFAEFNVPHVPAPVKTRQPRPIKARRQHLQHVMDHSDMPRLLQGVSIHHTFDAVPGHHVSLTIDGQTVISVRRNPDGTLAAQAQPDYWTGAALPDPGQPAAHSGWTTHQALTIAVAQRAADVIAEHWPETTDQGRSVKAPTADVVYRHRRGIANTMPPHLQQLIDADDVYSPTIAATVASLIDPDVYRVAASMANAPPNIAAYNTAVKHGAVIRQAQRENPAATAVFVKMLATRPNLAIPQSARLIIKTATDHVASMGWSEELWEAANDLAPERIHEALDYHDDDSFAIARLCAAAHTTVSPNSQQFRQVLTAPNRLGWERTPQYTPNLARAAALCIRHIVQHQRWPQYNLRHLVDYVEDLDLNAVPFHHRNWEDAQAAIDHWIDNRPPGTPRQQFQRDMRESHDWQKCWNSLVEQSEINGFDVRPVTDQHELMELNEQNPGSSVYRRWQDAARGNARIFALTETGKPQETPQIAVIEIQENHWTFSTDPDDCGPDAGGVNPHTGNRIAQLYDAAYHNTAPSQRHNGGIKISPLYRDEIHAADTEPVLPF